MPTIGRTTAYRIERHADGKLDRGVAAADQRLGADFVGPTNTGFVRYAVGEDDRNRVRSFARSPEKLEWAELPRAGRDLRPAGRLVEMSKDSQRVSDLAVSERRRRHLARCAGLSSIWSKARASLLIVGLRH